MKKHEHDLLKSQYFNVFVEFERLSEILKIAVVLLFGHIEFCTRYKSHIFDEISAQRQRNDGHFEKKNGGKSRE